MTTEQMLLAAAEFTCQLVGSNRCRKLTSNSLGLCGQELLAWFDETDQLDLFLPVELSRGGGKASVGCVLTLQDRAVFAWLEGSFKLRRFQMRNCEAVVPYDTITRTEITSRPAGKFSGAQEQLQVVAADDWTIRFKGLESQEVNLPAVLESALLGFTRFPRAQ